MIEFEYHLLKNFSFLFPAIIGGGIGGTATAYFLHELTKGKALIDVYESGRVGGRLASIPFAGHYYEIGGSILHPANQYMTKFVSELGECHPLPTYCIKPLAMLI